MLPHDRFISMAKHSSPIRLEKNLMSAAQNAALLHKRTASEQIEYWADLGKSVSKIIDPETLIAVRSGLAKLTVERVNAEIIDPEDVFGQLERQRTLGELSHKVTSASFKYQASKEHPGLLDQVDSQGNHTAGNFNNGRFVALDLSC